jgi:threonine/homoserine/homoserine lactone efflux protein
MTVAMFVAWAALALALTLTPGPDTLLVAGSAVRRGVAAGLAATAGTVAGGVVYALLCGFGFLSLLTAVPALYGLVKLAGAAYLAFIALTLLREALRPKPDAASAESSVAPVASVRGLAAFFRRGLVTNALNPKIALFYLAVLPQFTGRGPDAPLLGVALIAIHYLIGGLWLSIVALSAGRAGAALKGVAVTRWLHGAIGVLMLGLAGKLALERR